MDNQELFSTRRPKLDPADCPATIRSAVHELKAAFGEDQVGVVYWDEPCVGITISVPVNIPTRGPVGGIDIRPIEPLLVLVHTARYPNFAPSVHSDRPNFPSHQLPHLNPTLEGDPPSLCLYRGNIHDWFAEHTLLDLVSKAQDWLRDAASDRLIRQDDHFEPTRPHIERLVGIAIYDQRQLEKHIQRWWSTHSGQPGGTYLSCQPLRLDQRGSSLEKLLLTLRLGKPLSRKEAFAEQESIRTLFQGYPPVPSTALLIWPARSHVCRDYFGVLPHNFESLIAFAESLGMPIKKELQRYWAQCNTNPPAMRFSFLLPVILVIKRPQPLIGSDSSIEFLNFLIAAIGDWKPNQAGWLADTPVFQLGHRTPLTPALARKLSGFPEVAANGRLLLIGCGALGSKIGLHLARAGFTNLTLVDHDELAPHNLIRHALLTEQLGQNKALALKQTIETMFQDHQQRMGVTAVPENVYEVLYGGRQAQLLDHSWIVDCSASVSVHNMLADTHRTMPVISSEIAFAGKLGILMREGRERNPRVDDLQMHLYDLAIDDDKIAAWLQQQEDESTEIGSGLEEITIGLGCSTDTMRMADDVISYHAALAAMSIRDSLLGNDQRSGVQVSYLDDKLDTGGSAVFHEVASLQGLIPLNTSRWLVRLSHKAYHFIQTQMLEALPDETGGILVGFIHFKRKVIYVTRALAPPPDSIGFPYAFKLGIRDVPEQLEMIYQRTGGVIHYVGEWHSHPCGDEQLSASDRTAVKQISGHLGQGGIPTHIMIATTQGCFSHLFENPT